MRNWSTKAKKQTRSQKDNMLSTRSSVNTGRPVKGYWETRTSPYSEPHAVCSCPSCKLWAIDVGVGSDGFILRAWEQVGALRTSNSMRERLRGEQLHPRTQAGLCEDGKATSTAGKGSSLSSHRDSHRPPELCFWAPWLWRLLGNCWLIWLH